MAKYKTAYPTKWQKQNGEIAKRWHVEMANIQKGKFSKQWILQILQNVNFKKILIGLG